MTQIYNRPGLSQLGYRAGTFGSFREAMLRAAAASPELASLTSRQSDDYGVAIMEMWAYVADILTFYQERYVQEAFLRTAVHRDSLQRLGALVAHSPRPGTAAQTHVAFRVEGQAPVTLPAGLRLQSRPGPGEQPQKYETAQPVKAWEALNQVPLSPLPEVTEETNPFRTGGTGGTLAPGFDPGRLAPGTGLLLYRTDPASPLVAEKKIREVVRQGTRAAVTFSPPMLQGAPFPSTRAATYRRTFRLFGHDAPPQYVVATPGPEPGQVIYETKTTNYATAWEDDSGAIHGLPYLDLDGLYEEVQENTRLLIHYQNPHGEGWSARLVTVTSVAPAMSRAGDPEAPIATATVTRAFLDQEVLLHVNEAVLYELEETVPFWGAEYPAEIPAGADTVYIPADEIPAADQMVERDRPLLLTDGSGPPEAVTAIGIAAVTREAVPYLAIRFSPALSRPLRTETALLYGNVAPASHGETVGPEILGSGDPAQAGQSFTLKKAPVTFAQSVDADTGAEPALTVWVDGIRWARVSSFYGRGPEDRVYVAEAKADGTVTVRFGDGVNGARLPRGLNNVVAQYRQGSGAAAAVRADTLISLLDRPRGLRSATNPGAATGGADPEPDAEIRRSIPAMVRTFGRAVSLQDYEGLALNHPGVAKAKAGWVWNGSDRVLHLTVAGPGGSGVDLTALRRFLDAHRDPNLPLALGEYTPVPIEVGVRIQIAPDRDGAAVEAAVHQALTDALAFDARSFGEPVIRSDLYRLIQSVPGVEALLVTHLRYKDRQTPDPKADRLTIRPARFDPETPGGVRPAELAWVEAPLTDILVEREESL